MTDFLGEVNAEVGVFLLTLDSGKLTNFLGGYPKSVFCDL